MGDRFIRSYWYEPGIEYGNPVYNTRFRVNSPEASLHPTFMYRSEAQENGMMQIPIHEDLAQLAGAELYCEIWGGHPGTANKRVTINGRSTYALPEVGTAAGHCTHMYPTVPLRVSDLVNGHNAVQYACDQGSSFWGHFIVDQASLRAVLKPDHHDLQAAGLSGFRAALEAAPGEGESLHVCLRHLGPSCTDAARVGRVDFYGSYRGYDETSSTESPTGAKALPAGSAFAPAWHGFTKSREPVAHLGTLTEPPWALDWDLSMLPDQEGMAARAVVHFRDCPGVTYETGVLEGLSTPPRGARVRLYAAQGQPAPFWSRDSREQRCNLPLDVDPASVERATLHVVIWDGGRGEVEAPFNLNGHSLPVAGDGNHDVLYRQIELDPNLLRRGENEIRLLSDTEHHGIEVLRPGPALMVRTRE
jgi:hypothetical protein